MLCSIWNCWLSSECLQILSTSAPRLNIKTLYVDFCTFESGPPDADTAAEPSDSGPTPALLQFLTAVISPVRPKGVSFSSGAKIKGAVTNPDGLLFLSLRGNKLPDSFGQQLFRALAVNSSVAAVNASGNCFQGATAQAAQECLLVNKVLISVSLASNQLAEQDVSIITQALYAMPMTAPATTAPGKKPAQPKLRPGNVTLQTLNLARNPGLSLAAAYDSPITAVSSDPDSTGTIRVSAAASLKAMLAGNTALQQLWLDATGAVIARSACADVNMPTGAADAVDPRIRVC